MRWDGMKVIIDVFDILTKNHFPTLTTYNAIMINI